MTVRGREKQTAGLAGPAAVLAGAFLIALAAVLRAGDYFIALIPIEIVSLVVLVAIVSRTAFAPAGAFENRHFDRAVALLLASPLIIAIVQLTPVPAAVWNAWPGHARYVEALAALGLSTAKWRPLSISPDQTRASLLAALPLIAVFLLGSLATVRQLRIVVRIVAAVAFGEVVLGLLQVSGGEHSPFYFGMMTYGSPIGSLGTRNEYANLLSMALAVYIWLAYDTTRYKMRLIPGAPLTKGRFDDRHALAAWFAGGLVLVVGILMSRSRAGAAFGLLAAVTALAAAGLRVFGWSRGWRFAAPIALLLIAGAVAMIGLDNVASRLTTGELRSSAGFRGELARTSFHAALAYLPFGSGWGTYDIAYRPFQTAAITGYPNHAHMDYVEMFLEGGLLFVAAAALFAWVALRRAGELARQAWRERTLDRELMMAAVAGIGLVGFLLHACVDFPMRVPANAIVASLLAGIFLRPLPVVKDGAPA